jgi:hypothetical protein
MSIESDYSKYLEKSEIEFDKMCSRCGECCGSKDDPCDQLARDKTGTYFCECYDTRFGPQKTLSGNPFTCVSIREHLRHKSLRPSCKYLPLC